MLDAAPEDRALAVVAALWNGQVEFENPDQQAMLMQMLNGMVGPAHAQAAFDTCGPLSQPDFATMSMQGSTGTFGSGLEPIDLDAHSSFCWNSEGQANSNASNQLYKSFAMAGVIATCSWGETYNLSGSGAYRSTGPDGKDVYGSFAITGETANGTYDCSMGLVNAPAIGDELLGDTVQSGSCTDQGGRAFSDWTGLSAGASCVLSVGNAPVYDAPNAVCGDASADYALSAVEFDGSGSTHPNNALLTYSWTLSAPEGSASVLADANTASPSIVTDLAGEYEATLTVTGPDGQSDSCTQVSSAVPYENFRAEMYWTTHTDDMDLHLLRPYGTNSLRSQGDCYYSNTNPNWGFSSESADDPRLDIDDIYGMGPENINIDDPALNPEFTGWYQVVVHDYPWTIWDEGSNEVVVNLYLNGVISRTFTFDLPGEDDYYYVAKVHWPSGDIVECNGLSGCP